MATRSLAGRASKATAGAAATGGGAAAAAAGDEAPPGVLLGPVSTGCGCSARRVVLGLPAAAQSVAAPPADKPRVVPAPYLPPSATALSLILPGSTPSDWARSATSAASSFSRSLVADAKSRSSLTAPLDSRSSGAGRPTASVEAHEAFDTAAQKSSPSPAPGGARTTPGARLCPAGTATAGESAAVGINSARSTPAPLWRKPTLATPAVLSASRSVRWLGVASRRSSSRRPSCEARVATAAVSSASSIRPAARRATSAAAGSASRRAA
mmetsp:Transcript_36966/g.123880  ORF Transcript_36966/g.123880 Transcript_36966/m.123880 type:complete len:269 (-) Transcript_36966:49-855(-)